MSEGTGDGDDDYASLIVRDDDYASLMLTAGTSFYLRDCCKNSVKQYCTVQYRTKCH